MLPKAKPSKRNRPHVPFNLRKRALRACVPCRDGKKKCLPGSGRRCENCTRSGQLCTFEEIPKSVDRTIQQDSSTITSTAWETLAKDVSQKFDQQCPGNRLEPEQFSLLSKLFEAAVKGEGPGAHALSAPANVSTPAVDDHALCRPDASFLADVREMITSNRGEVNDAELQDRASRSKGNRLARTEDASLVREAMVHLPPQDEAESLVTIFFTFLESNWYYFDESWLRDMITGLYEMKIPAPQHESANICLTFLVLALGSSFHHLAVPSHPFKTLDSSDEIPGRRYYVQATKLIPAALASNSVESVICCLLTALYVLPTQDISHHHTYLSLALSLAVGLSLHRKGVDGDIYSRIFEVRNRLFWTVYCLERRTAVFMGLPTMLQSGDITSPLPQERLDLDGDDSHKVNRLIAFTKLTMAMDKVISMSPIESSSTSYASACSTLESWKQSAPVPAWFNQSSSLRATAHLDIMYNMIWLEVGRAAVLRLVQRKLRHSIDGKPTDDEFTLRSQELSITCAKAAKTIVEWMSLLHGQNLLAKFSFTDFHSCSSAVIILLLSTILDPNDGCQSLISRGLDALDFMGQGSQLARDAHRLVQQLRSGMERYIDTSVTRPSRHGPDSTSSHGLLLPEAGSYTLMEDVPKSPSCEDPTPINTMPFAALFTELEPSLVSHSEDELALFGFSGFNLHDI